MKVCLAMATLVVAAPLGGVALADGGYYSGVLGARASGRAGAFTAKADDLSAVSYNPAGLATLGTTLFEAGNQVSYNAYSYTRAPTFDYGDGHQDPATGAAPSSPSTPCRTRSHGKPFYPCLAWRRTSG